MSKVDLGGVQGQARPSGTKGSGPLRTCQSDSDAGWTGVWPGVAGWGPVRMILIPRVDLEFTTRPPNFTRLDPTRYSRRATGPKVQSCNKFNRSKSNDDLSPGPGARSSLAAAPGAPMGHRVDRAAGTTPEPLWLEPAPHCRAPGLLPVPGTPGSGLKPEPIPSVDLIR